MSELAAILLAGGRGSRMGGVHKPLLEVGGVSLLDAAITAAREVGCDPIIAVGPAQGGPQSASVTWVREDPPFGGPVLAILTALPLIAAPRVLVLACDLPRVGEAVRLLCAQDFSRDGVCLTDESGRRQWLTGLYRADALRAAAATIPDGGRDAAVRALVGELAITAVAASDALAADIDTWDDLSEARRSHP